MEKEEITTIQLPRQLRQRLKILAAKEGCHMYEWIEKRVKIAEEIPTA